MRKKIKQKVSLGLMLCLMSSISTINFASADSNGTEMLQVMGNASEEKLLKEQKKNQLEDALQQNAKAAYNELQDVVDDSAVVEKEYAGAYINDENQLVVGLTTSSRKVKDIVQENTESQEVKFETQEYSYEELMTAYRDIQDAIENTDYAGIVSCFYVDEMNNAVVVKMKDISYAEAFKQDICSAECIRFVESAHSMKPCKTYLKPGGYIEGIAGSYSIGWRGWRINNAGNRTEGFVTAGHYTKLNDIAYTSGGNIFGKFVLKRYGGKLDMAFVQRTNNNYDVSNTIKFSGSSLKAGYYVRSSKMCIGDKVYKVGMTTGLTSGKILSTSYSDTYDNKTFNDFVMASYYSDEGDSGGLVYMDFEGAYRIVGNNVAFGEDNKPGDAISVLVKAENIIQDVKIYPY